MIKRPVYLRLSESLRKELHQVRHLENRPSLANMIEHACKSYADWKIRGIPLTEQAKRAK